MTVVPEAPARSDHAARHARALAALRSAERAVPARPRPTPVGVPGPGDDAPPAAGPPRTAPPRGGRAVHPDLAPLLPGGVLPTGGVLAVQGSTSLLLGLLAAPSRAGAWTVLVGAPAVGLLAAADAGIDLARTVVVPAPGPDAPAVLAALLDGMDVVVVGPQAPLADADRRRLAARARQREAVLVAAGRWAGAHVTLDARGGTWTGVDAGAGWLRRRTLRVLRTGRGASARPVEIDVEVPLGGEPPLAASPADTVAQDLPGLPDDRHLRVA
ncbi:hypothetical protein Q6350_14050 [Isoptericola sp. b515]|uniref:hypothetical protein n=1 Tax=Isoptericola sp. b515 TaxID=3064652 RepID=UPI0027133618|nr:hypothetical protein [Isoptericola sp. b515]MDO8149554.1 hypothetical protein [Isoptericola sp. b515]